MCYKEVIWIIKVYINYQLTFKEIENIAKY
jgi:hypothetical protein